MPQLLEGNRVEGLSIEQLRSLKSPSQTPGQRFLAARKSAFIGVHRRFQGSFCEKKRSAKGQEKPGNSGEEGLSCSSSVASSANAPWVRRKISICRRSQSTTQYSLTPRRE